MVAIIPNCLTKKSEKIDDKLSDHSNAIIPVQSSIILVPQNKLLAFFTNSSLGSVNARNLHQSCVTLSNLRPLRVQFYHCHHPFD